MSKTEKRESRTGAKKEEEKQKKNGVKMQFKYLI